MTVRKGRALLYAGALALLAAITWADTVTGYELGLFILYFVPVALAAWYGSRSAAILFAVAAGACWYLSDRLTHHPYSTPWLIYWESFMRLCSFAIAALTLSKIRADLRRREELLDIISHDLRAPLGALVGQARILGKTTGDGFTAARVDAILRCGARMDTMIEDLLDAARQESSQLRLATETIALSAYLAELVERCAAVLDAGRIRLAVDDPSLAVRADPGRLERVVVNLLLNALKYSPPESPVELGASRGDGAVILRVADRGRGIPRSDLAHVFDRFYRGEGGRAAGGLGIGLYSVRLLVEAHGGTVRAVPGAEGGTTFLVALPAA